jgi:glycosyltransferase involved in cell wall biosynthesis
VIPCLNEADTLAECIRAARRSMDEAGIGGEVLVADNGSTDGSDAIALEEGARLVRVAAKGYGAALMGGIAEARGRYVVMGDADMSYDLGETPAFVEKLREGYDLVQGCRLPSGGGTVLPGAMPFLHRHFGNPLLSALARRLFQAPVTDVYCGLRGFRRDWQLDLQQRSPGMEFATEMIVKASLGGARVTEIPITLRPDGRRAHPPHLRTFRDGWRTLRLFLLFSPAWLFAYPGLLLLALCAAGYLVALPGVRIGGVRFDANTLLFATLAGLVGHQALVFASATSAWGVREGGLPRGGWIARFLRSGRLENWLLSGVMLGLAGAGLLGAAVVHWWTEGFGDLDYPLVLRLVIPGTLLAGLGVQTIFGAFFLALIDVHGREVR